VISPLYYKPAVNVNEHRRSIATQSPQSRRGVMPLQAKHDAKVVILGASGVGKTCIGLRFVKDQWIP